jgi:TDG/mug DNA glycosylase family protein
LSILPDLLRPDLRLVLCGTAAGRRSAELGCYYAHPGNRFWTVLHRVGLTPRLFAPAEAADLLDLGIGLTDMNQRESGGDSGLTAAGWDAPAFLAKLDRLRPARVAFTGKKAASICLGKPTRALPYGLQDEMLAGAECRVLPSPSGSACAYWDETPWRALAASLAEDGAPL